MQLRRELQPYTQMEPAPSMAEVHRKLRLKVLTACRKFPAEYKLIVWPHQQRRRTMAGLRRLYKGLLPPFRRPAGVTALPHFLACG